MAVHRKRHMVNLWSGIELVLLTITEDVSVLYTHLGSHSAADIGSAMMVVALLLPRCGLALTPNINRLRYFIISGTDAVNSDRIWDIREHVVCLYS
jgi:hypothetical protein